MIVSYQIAMLPDSQRAKLTSPAPPRTNQTMRHVATLAVGSFNTFTIRRVSLHNLAFGSVTDASASLCAGIDGLSIRKDSTFSLAINVDVAYTTIVG